MCNPNEPQSPIVDYLQGVLERLRGLSHGRLPDYIPEPARANPGWFGICIVTIRLLENLALGLSSMVREANRELAVLK